jgi:hypothetical protein
MRFGFFSNAANDPPSDGIWFRYGNTTGCTSNLSDTTWIGESRASSTSTTVDTGVTVSDDTAYMLRIRSTTAGTILFSAASGGGAYSAEQSITTNIPTGTLTMALQFVACADDYTRTFNPDALKFVMYSVR